MLSEQIQSPVRCPNDLIDEEWEIIEAIISELDHYTTGRPRTTDLREIMNAIFYIEPTHKSNSPARSQEQFAVRNRQFYSQPINFRH
jgi:hypothetical protein